MATQVDLSGSGAFNTGTLGCVPNDWTNPYVYPQPYQSERVTKRTIKTTKTYDEKGRVTSEEKVEEITYGNGYYVTNTTTPQLYQSADTGEIQSTHYYGDGHDHGVQDTDRV